MKNEKEATATTLARLLQNQKDIDSGKDLDKCKITIDNCNSINNTVKNSIRMHVLAVENKSTTKNISKQLR